MQTHNPRTTSPPLPSPHMIPENHHTPYTHTQVSKLDTVNFDQHRFECVCQQLAPFLQERCGFKASSLQWLPAVGPTGDNVSAPPTEPRLAWWQGPTLLQAIDALPPPARAVDRPLRVSVSDVFKGPRGGVVVGGKVEVRLHALGHVLGILALHGGLVRHQCHAALSSVTHLSCVCVTVWCCDHV